MHTSTESALGHEWCKVLLTLNIEEVHSKHFIDFHKWIRQGLWLISLVVDSIIPTYVALNSEQRTRLVFKGSWNQQYKKLVPDFSFAKTLFPSSRLTPAWPVGYRQRLEGLKHALHIPASQEWKRINIKPFPNYTKPFRNYTKPFRNYTKPFVNHFSTVQNHFSTILNHFATILNHFSTIQNHLSTISQLYKTISQPFLNYTKPFLNCTKPFRNYTKPFLNYTKPFLNHF